MALNDNHDDDLERDPQLARLYQAAQSAAGEEPPAALDAAILAAARREVGARPQVVGGGGEAAGPLVSRKRSWYVPLSVAAVLVLSVSVVTLVHEQKGDELAQPPKAASEPPSPPRPAKPDAALRDAAPAKEKTVQEPYAEPAKRPVPTEAAAGTAEKQRAQNTQGEVSKATPPAEVARKDQHAREPATAPKVESPAAARQEKAANNLPDRSPAPVTGARSGQPAPGTAAGGLSAGTQASAPDELARERRPEPFAAASEREAAPATDRDARARSEADRVVTQRMTPAAPAPPTAEAAAPRAAPPNQDTQMQSALPTAEGRVQAAPSPPSATKPALRRGGPLPATRPVWLSELDNQPPEKWLERLAEFKREGRQVDADALLVEFRRRFPDHPASAR